MDDKVLTFIKDNHLIPSNGKVLTAVSGGPDSLALLHFLWRYQHRLGIALHAMTIDHQLRGDISEADVRYVEEMCAVWDIPCFTAKVDVPAHKATYQVGTQVAARELRYDAFHKQMISENFDVLAFGHHADDQIETVLMALMKTTHLHNLTGMPRQRSFGGGDIIRPFLCVDKSEIMSYLATHQLEPRIDTSNFDKVYTRNRLRADIVPLLKKENPNLATTIGKLTETLQEDESFLTTQAKKAFEQSVTINKQSMNAVIHIQNLQTYSVSLQRKVFRLILDYLYQTLPEQLSYKHEDMFFSLLHGKGNRMMNFPIGLTVERAYDSLYFYFPVKGEDSNQSWFFTEIPATLRLPDGMVLTCEAIPESDAAGEGNDVYTYMFSASQVHFPLLIRTRCKGDRMTYDGLEGTKKLNKIFIDEKIPRHERASWPVLVDATGEILWVMGLKKNTKRRMEQAPDTWVRVQPSSLSTGGTECNMK